MESDTGDMPGLEDYRRIKLRLIEETEAFKDKKTIQIIKFIKDYQRKNPKGELTKEEITRYMDNAGFLSRPVTLRIIKELLDKRVLLNAPKKPNAQSSIIINPEFDFKEVELTILILLINEIREMFEPINIETRGANTTLIRELQATIINFRKKEEIYSPKQMEKFESDYEKKLLKQFEKRRVIKLQ